MHILTHKHIDAHTHTQIVHKPIDLSRHGIIIQLMPLLDSLRKVRESLKRVEVDDSEAAMIRCVWTHLRDGCEEYINCRTGIRDTRDRDSLMH